MPKKTKKDGTPSKQGEGGGRPMKYKTVKELEQAIDAYFDECDKNTEERVVVVDGTPKKINAPDPDPYTIEGLAYALGMDRFTLLDYENEESHEKFHHTIKEAKRKILGQKVKLGLKKKTNPIITIFDLKNNYGYEDKKVVDQTNREGEPVDPLDSRGLKAKD